MAIEEFRRQRLYLHWRRPIECSLRRFPFVKLSQQREPSDDEPLLVFSVSDQSVELQLQRRARKLLLFPAVLIYQEING